MNQAHHLRRNGLDGFVDGIPLFTEAHDGPIRLVETFACPNGAFRPVYDTRPC